MPLPLLITMIASVVLGLIALEVLSLTLNEKHVAFRCELDMSLTEPDEVATLTYRVRNTAFWPIMFVGFSFLLNDEVEMREDEEWLRRHSGGGLFGGMYSFDACLMPHRALKGCVHISFKTRGRRLPGKVYLETGDFLGFRTKVLSFDIPGSVVCTARALDEPPLSDALGGFLGDVSVRRFIMEDPSLILGYRDYTGAEPLKSISWLQTAKTGRLTVKNHDFTVDNDAAVLLDMELCSAATAERCLSLVRTVCDRLEEARIPYSVHSNGDLFELEKGAGRRHNFELQRRVGVSKFVKYRDFAAVAERCAGRGFGRIGFIIVTPLASCPDRALEARLESISGIRPMILCGEVPKDA